MIRSSLAAFCDAGEQHREVLGGGAEEAFLGHGRFVHLAGELDMGDAQHGGGFFFFFLGVRLGGGAAERIRIVAEGGGDQPEVES